MRLKDHDFETLFQTALVQFDNRPSARRALNQFYGSLVEFLTWLIRQDAARRRGHDNSPTSLAA